MLLFAYLGLCLAKYLAAAASGSHRPLLFAAGHMTIYVLVVALVSATGGMLFG